MPKRSSLFVFIGVICVILSIVNVVVYQALALMFGIVEPVRLLLLALALGFSSASFITALILGNFYYNWFTRLYYRVFAVWMGFFFYILLASFIYGIAVSITGLPLITLGTSLLTFASMTGFYGVMHARRIKVKKQKVTLPNLPAAWKGRKAVWISDLHLGQVQGTKFAQHVTDKILKISPDIVFVGGDLFDGTSAPDLHNLAFPLSQLSTAKKIPHGVYFITGNHEEFGKSDAFLSAVSSVGMKILMDEMVDIEGLQLIGVDYRNTTKKEDFKEVLARLSIDRAKPSILLKHEPKDLDVAEEAGVSLQLSGHTHRAQIWPLRYIAKLIYKTYVYGLKPHGSMQVNTSSGVGTWGPPLRVGSDSEIVLIEF